MQLFDVFYHGNTMDSNVPFPLHPDPQIKRVVNTNWDGRSYVVKRVPDQDAIAKMIRESREFYSDNLRHGYDSCDYQSLRKALMYANVVTDDDGSLEHVPDSPDGEAFWKFIGYWLSLGRPELTCLDFVEEVATNND